MTFTFQPGGSINGDPTIGWEFDGDDDFDDATGTTADNTYGSAGTKTVKMRVTDADGTTEVSHDFDVNDPPPPPNRDPSVTINGFSPASPTHGPGHAVSFSSTASDPDGDIPTYDWDFGDGGHSTAADPSHTYTSPGTYSVKVTVSDGNGGTDDATTSVTVTNRSPSVSVSASPSTVVIGQTVSFPTTASDPNGDTLTYSWSYGDGSTGSGSNPPPAHAYSTPGSKTVTVTVSDGRSGTATDTATVTVQNRAPNSDFTFDPPDPFPGDEVSFTAEASDPDGDTLTYAWSFGDGSTSTAVNPKHTYSSPGAKTVTLTVRDGRDGLDTETRQVIVVDPSSPVGGFTYSPNVPLGGEGVTFTDASQATVGVLTAWLWDLDDDGEYDDATGPSATTSFSTPGAHDVWLQVRQSNGKVGIERRTIRVNAPPIAGFVWSPLAPVTRQAVDLFSVASDAEGGVSHAWDLDGDGQYDDSTSANVRQSWAKAGAYEVGLLVTDSDGAVSTIRRSITILASSRGTAQLRFITPFPVVRLAGAVFASSTRVQVLTVRAPRKSKILVKCTGKGCPVKRVSKVSRGKLVRFRAFENNLRPGITLEIFVRQAGRIGKYTRFLIRDDKPPKRRDSCLFPGRERPKRCP